MTKTCPCCGEEYEPGIIEIISDKIQETYDAILDFIAELADDFCCMMFTSAFVPMDLHLEED